MVTVAAAPASARISERTIKRECRAANNGTYETSLVTRIDGTTVRQSSCLYRDTSGNTYVDYFENGEYYATY
jgi:hypothetical protein